MIGGRWKNLLGHLLRLIKTAPARFTRSVELVYYSFTDKLTRVQNLLSSLRHSVWLGFKQQPDHCFEFCGRSCHLHTHWNNMFLSNIYSKKLRLFFLRDIYSEFWCHHHKILFSSKANIQRFSKFLKNKTFMFLRSTDL